MSNPYRNKKIAVLAAGSVRGEMGGAERFYQGLVEALVARDCDAELVSIPADESTFDAILANYERVRSLDLSAYDLVISTKTPTFAANHPNHLLYLVHTTRVFYDMFDDMFPAADVALRRQRRTIQEMDTDAIRRIKHRFTIGHEVSERLRKFNGLDSEVLHPPLGVRDFHPGKEGDYFLLPGRLHPWKRIDLVIRAVKDSKLPLRLLIAGTGEAEADLRKLAGGDNRIEFLGRVSDAELVELYANALAVPFAPLREDYGYVTLEAFASGKPVVTCNDSGEPLQFVKHGVTGLVCDPQPASLQAAFEHLFSNRGLAIQLGTCGLRSIEHTSWPNVAERLLSAGFAGNGAGGHAPDITRRNTKVAILDMQPIEPAVGGGRLRLLGLYHALGADLQARYVGTYDWPGEKYRCHKLSPGLEETDVPLSDAHHAAAKQLSQEAGGKTVIDIAFPRLCHLSPEYLAKAREAVEWADVVIFSHPWVYPLLSGSLKVSQLVVYDSQNVEGFLRAQLLDERNPVEAQLLREVVQAEYALGSRSDLILACGKEDLDLFVRIYEWPADKIHVVPNAVMASKITPASQSGRIHARQRVGLAMDQMAAIFIGSQYQPNVEAANFIVRSLAPRLQDCNFVIAGGVGAGIRKKLPSNVTVTGLLDDDQKLAWLQACDFAVNPMFSGSGTNIKMFDYMAAGLPVVCTDIGARGIETAARQPLLIADPDPDVFASSIRRLMADEDELRRRSIDARTCVEDVYSWELLSPRLGYLLTEWQTALTCPKPPSRLAHLSTVGHKCGIGEYTARLLEAISATGVRNYLVTCTTPTVRPQVADLPAQGEIGWHYDDETWRTSRIDESVASRLRAWGASHVIVHYHLAFFSSETLVRFAESCLRSGIDVAIVVHNLTTTDFSGLVRLKRLGCLLIVHSRREIADAAARNLATAHLPLFVPAHQARARKSIAGRDFRRNPPVIASTGFVRSHKGLPQLIEALAILRRTYPGARLRLVCALHSSPDSLHEYKLCMKKITRLGLREAVDFENGFLPIEEVHDRLSGADFAILPYGPSNEGGSGAASSILASGVPLLVSRSQVFEEIASAALVLSDTEPQTIADALLRLLREPALYDDLAERGFNYAESHSPSSIAQRLLHLLQHSRQRAAVSARTKGAI